MLSLYPGWHVISHDGWELLLRPNLLEKCDEFCSPPGSVALLHILNSAAAYPYIASTH